MPRLRVLGRCNEVDDPIGATKFGLPLRVVIPDPVHQGNNEIGIPQRAIVDWVEFPGCGQPRLDGLRFHPKTEHNAGAIAMYARQSLCLEQSGSEYIPQIPSSNDEEKSCEHLMPPEGGYLHYHLVPRVSLEQGC
jgi:hypothetical protein